MNFTTLISVFLVAILSVFGNIIFFRYQFKKDNKWKIRHQQLTELLLPLFYILESDELFEREYFHNDNLSPNEFFAEAPKRLIKKIMPIVEKNLYLADDELHSCCLQFLAWAHSVDENARYQESFLKGCDMASIDNFREMVYKKYNDARNKYI